MSQPDEATLAYWKENREQLRQSENQRAVLTNYVLVIAAAVGGLIAQQKFAFGTLPLSILIVLIGLYGALTTAKYHERAVYHESQARALTRVMVGTGALTDSGQVLDEYRREHYERYRRLRRVRLHWLWTGLHLGIAVYGTVLVIVTIVDP